MRYPKFFDEVEKIVTRDELARFLGVNEDGIIEFSYLDIVKVSGHSCATVAGAYLIALKGLKALYKEEIPERGKIKVEIKKMSEDDNAGVVGCVLSNITGATTNYGFGGIPGGKFNRRNLLFYGADIDTFVRLTRIDPGDSVGVNYNPKPVADPVTILMSAIGPKATDESKRTFPKRFQEMVEKILKNADRVIEIVK